VIMALAAFVVACLETISLGFERSRLDHGTMEESSEREQDRTYIHRFFSSNLAFSTN
jgi:hypothetical protein